MEHKEMLIWHKQTLKSEKGYKSRPNDRFGFKPPLFTFHINIDTFVSHVTGYYNFWYGLKEKGEAPVPECLPLLIINF